LSKGEQCSNWAKRPLRKSQLHYAALDAFICLKIYQEICKINNKVYLYIIRYNSIIFKLKTIQSLDSFQRDVVLHLHNQEKMHDQEQKLISHISLFLKIYNLKESPQN